MTLIKLLICTYIVFYDSSLLCSNWLNDDSLGSVFDKSCMGVSVWLKKLLTFIVSSDVLSAFFSSNIFNSLFVATPKD